MEDVAADIAAKDGKQLRPRDLAVAENLDRRGSLDAESRVGHEEAVYREADRDDEANDAGQAADDQDAAQLSTRKTSALDRYATTRPENRDLLVILIGESARGIRLLNGGEGARAADRMRTEDVVEAFLFRQGRCRAAELSFYFRHARARS